MQRDAVVDTPVRFFPMRRAPLICPRCGEQHDLLSRKILARATGRQGIVVEINESTIGICRGCAEEFAPTADARSYKFRIMFDKTVFVPFAFHWWMPVGMVWGVYAKKEELEVVA